MGKERRKFQRIATKVHVKFREKEVDDSALEYYEGVAKDSSLGGIFLATSHLFSPGSIVSLIFKFVLDNEEVEIKAKAIVRWTRRIFQPRGMGLEFFEFEGLAGRDFHRCLEQLFVNDEE
jgi:c-di-GMP-binding flagellar brake protein YcgR